jgi:hypothetical protein
VKFSNYVKRLNLRKRIIWLSTPRWMRDADLGWMRQDKSTKRKGGALLSPVCVCGAGHIQGRHA